MSLWALYTLPNTFSVIVLTLIFALTFTLGVLDRQRKLKHAHPLVSEFRRYSALGPAATEEDRKRLLDAGIADVERVEDFRVVDGRLATLGELVEELEGEILLPAVESGLDMLRVLESRVYAHVLKKEGHTFEVPPTDNPELYAAFHLMLARSTLRNLPMHLVKNDLANAQEMLDTLHGLKVTSEKLRRLQPKPQGRQKRKSSPQDHRVHFMTEIDRVTRERKEFKQQLDQRVAEDILSEEDAERYFENFVADQEDQLERLYQ